MTPDAPLTEVAAHLPVAAANILYKAESDVQVDVLTRVRWMIVYWESLGHDFDPIAYEAILDALVASTTPLIQEIYRLRDAQGDLHSALMGADLLIRSMGETIAAMTREGS